MQSKNTNKRIITKLNKTRLPAIDAMRGMVIVLMTSDHASYAYNAGRYATDSVIWYTSGTAIPALQFLVRWMTHICAPTFIFLAGLSMAYSIQRKSEEGIAGKRIDMELFIRGLIILALDPLWMSWGFGNTTMVLQVLYAIGGGFCCMVLLRRLKTSALLATGLVLLVGSEVLVGLALRMGGGQPAGMIGPLLASGGQLGNFGFVLYPLLPWLAMMIFGFVCGRMVMLSRITQPATWFIAAGGLMLVFFTVARGLNGYGNMMLYRENMSILQWLHVSKYPPSLSFSLMTMGLMCICLAIFFRLNAQQHMRPGNPLLVYGQAPLAFYLLHVHVLSGSAVLFGKWKTGGLMDTLIATAIVLLLLYPFCKWYTRSKKKHPDSFLRFI